MNKLRVTHAYLAVEVTLAAATGIALVIIALALYTLCLALYTFGSWVF